jgi:AraC-like DNA-binding protein
MNSRKADMVVHSSNPSGSVDPIDEIFAAMQVQCARYARIEATAPWGLSFARDQTARFGLVVRGGGWLSVEGVDQPIALAPGDCYVLVGGTPYILRDDLRTPTRNCAEVVCDETSGIINLGGGGAATTIITGWFTFDALSAQPLVTLLPPVLHSRMDQDRTHVLQATLQLLAMETAEPSLGSRLVISRLADIVFIQAIRLHIASSAGSSLGWLAALTDRRIGAVIQAIHQNPGHPWTVESLASVAGLSRSAFALRFKELVGESPVEYLTRWRMFRAACMLRRGDQPLSEIATLTGYESDVAFNKAFKRITGFTPGRYRRDGLPTDCVFA